MPIYNEASQTSFLLALRNLMVSYNIDVSSLNDNLQFRADFMNLIIDKDRQEARRIAEALKANLTLTQWDKARNILITSFPEITSEIGA